MARKKRSELASCWYSHVCQPKFGSVRGSRLFLLRGPPESDDFYQPGPPLLIEGAHPLVDIPTKVINLRKQRAVWILWLSPSTLLFCSCCLCINLILECEVKWALESITMNKTSGGDRIPVEPFQILKDDAVKVLHSICQKIWNTQQWPQDWKRSVFTPTPKKGNAKECSNYHTIALISHASKVMLKILQARLHQYLNRELPDVQAGFRKGRGTRDQTANICWIIEKAREFQKNIYFCFIDYAKAFDCVDHNKLWKISERDGSTRPPDRPLEKPVCRSGGNS